MNISPIFICFAGIDGSGKSSHAKLLQKYLQSSGITSIYTWSRWEPYLVKPFIKGFKGSSYTNVETSYNQNLRRKKQAILSNPVIRWLWLNSALFDYYWQVRKRVICHINTDNIVICDRYLYDLIVDQAINMGKGNKGMDYIFKFAFARLFPVPDLLFILDVEPEIGHARKNDGTTVEYLAERAELYRYLGNLPYATIIDTNNSLDIVANQIIERTTAFLKERGLINV